MMFAVTRQYQFSSDQVDAMLIQVHEGLLPVLKSDPGFVAYYVINNGAGAVSSISIFADQTAAERSSQRVVEWVGAHLPQVPERPVQVTEGEVVVHA